MRSQKIIEIAEAFYALILPFVVPNVKGQRATDPMRWLIPEHLCVQLITALANGAAEQREAIHKLIDERYKQYRGNSAAVQFGQTQ